MGRLHPEDDYKRLPEEELERRYSAVDQLAYGELWQRHEVSFVRQAHKNSRGDRELAEEGLAELRVKLGTPTIQRTYDPDQGSWRGWAGAILKNEIMNLRRKRACRKFRLSKQALRDLRKRGVPDDVCGKLGTAVGKTFYGEGSFRKRLGALLSPDEYDHHAEVIVQHALRERRQEPADAARSRERPPLGQAALPELARDIDAGLDQLDEDELIIFILRQFLGWTFARIAELLFGNPNPNLVAATYYRALQKMKHWLSDWGYSEDDLS